MLVSSQHKLTLTGMVIISWLYVEPPPHTNPEVQTSFNVSPNPFTDHLQVTAAQAIEVKNITGITVFKGKTEGNTVDTDAWSQGVYLLSTVDGRTMKVVKQ
jgi:hypothetical protein